MDHPSRPFFPKPEDFTSQAFAHQTVLPVAFARGECRRFHLSFSYVNSERGHVNHGDSVVFAPTIGQAAAMIARERGLEQLFVRKRHFSGAPASQSETINTVFDVEAQP